MHIQVLIRQHPTGLQACVGGSDHDRGAAPGTGVQAPSEAVLVTVAEIRDLPAVGSPGGDDRRGRGKSTGRPQHNPADTHGSQGGRARRVGCLEAGRGRLGARCRVGTGQGRGRPAVGGDLHAAVHDQASRDTTPSDGTRASRQALQADLANALERSTRQAQRISQLENKLSHVLGENAWRESGLGAPGDVDTLQQRITSLEQQLAAAALQLAARNDDLDAARSANRELMAQINHRET